MTEQPLKKAPITIKDPLSFGVSHPLKMLRNGICIGVGTGFFYSYGDDLFLITAGHNVTGTNPETNDNKGIPAELGILIYTMKDGVTRDYQQYEIALEGSDARYLIHPIHGLSVDVVAIQWKKSIDNLLIKPINKMDFDNKLPISPGTDIYVLGYPHGYSAYPTIAPIWKRGSLATELAIDLDGFPKVYVDTATASGMSGSPVIAKLHGMYAPEGETSSFENMTMNGGRNFLGIYTGRYTDQETLDLKNDIFNAQLGIVWKKNVIDEIITGLRYNEP